MNSIDLSKINKNSRNQYDWEDSCGTEINFCFKGNCGTLIILGVNKEFNYKIDVKYNGNIFTISKQQVVNCKLNPILKIKNEIPFKYNIGDIFIDDKRNLEILEQKRDIYIDKTGYKHNVRNYRCKCYVCGSSDIWISEPHLNENRGCPVCHSKQFDENIISIPVTASWMIPYFQGGYNEAKLYTKSSSKKILFKCPDCGEIKDKEMQINKLYQRHTISCTCEDGISYPNKIAYYILKYLEIKFIREYSPNWIKPMRYDFYFELDDKKYILEMDGGLGHGNRVHSKSKLTGNDLIERDNYKDNKAKEKGINIIRVDCLVSDINYIKHNLLKSELSRILNLININWLDCDSFALKNTVKEVCDYWHNNLDITVSDLMCKFNLDRSTICRYLHKGNKLGWCYYNGLYKPVEVYKNDTSLGVYKSAKYISDNSNFILGININQQSIKNVCTGYIDNCKGYSFKYTH